MDTDTGEAVEKTLQHEAEKVRAFYSALVSPVHVGIEATGSMHWFLELMEELGERPPGGSSVVDPQGGDTQAEARSEDAALLLKLQVENRFPSIWMPSAELRDLRTLLMHRHQWLRMRTRVQNALQAIALSRGLRRGKTLWSQVGQHAIESLPLPPNAAYRRAKLQNFYRTLNEQVDELDKRVSDLAFQRPGAKLLMTHPGVGRVTALASDVFLGDPARFADGQALVSYVGMIPSEYSSGGQQRLGGLSKQGNPLLRFLWCEGAVHAVPETRSCSASIGASCHRRDWAKREWLQLANSGFGCGSCCVTRSITKSSVVASKCGRKAVVPVRVRGVRCASNDRRVELSAIVGSNRQFIEATIPHIGALLDPSLERAVKEAEVVVLGRDANEFGGLRGLLTPAQIIVQLTRSGDLTVPGEQISLC